MKITITQFDRLGRDEANNLLPLGRLGLASQSRTSAGAFTALDPSANIVRVASDTAITLTDAGGREMYFPANAPEYIGVAGGEVFTAAVVA